MADSGDANKLFRAFFPNLTEENWQAFLSKKSFSLSEAPYQLKIENNSTYGQNCHFCEDEKCYKNCPLPFRADMTVLDLLHKVGQEDNVSFFHNGRGKRDLILNVVWNREIKKDFVKHLSSHETLKPIKEIQEQKGDGVLTIEDCFSEYGKSEILD